MLDYRFLKLEVEIYSSVFELSRYDFQPSIKPLGPF